MALLRFLLLKLSLSLIFKQSLNYSILLTKSGLFPVLCFESYCMSFTFNLVDKAKYFLR